MYGKIKSVQSNLAEAASRCRRAIFSVERFVTLMAANVLDCRGRLVREQCAWCVTIKGPTYASSKVGTWTPI